MNEQERKIAERYDELLNSGVAPPDAAQQVAAEHGIADVDLIDELYDMWLDE